MAKTCILQAGSKRAWEENARGKCAKCEKEATNAKYVAKSRERKRAKVTKEIPKLKRID